MSDVVAITAEREDPISLVIDDGENHVSLSVEDELLAHGLTISDVGFQGPKGDTGVPTGFATEVTLAQVRDSIGNIKVDADTIIVNTDEVETKLSAIVTTLSDGSLRLGGNPGVSQFGTWTVGVSNFPSTFGVTGPLTDSQLRATALSVTGSVSVSNLPSSQAVTGPLTDTQLRATALPVSGSVTVSNLPTTQAVSGTVTVGNFPGTQAVSGPLTDTQLRATPIPVSNASLPLPTGAAKDSTLTDGTQRVGGTVAVSGPLTDAQLRATALPVSGSVTTGGLTDAQLRASTVPVSGAVSVSNLPATQAVSGTFWQATQPVSGTVSVSGTVPVSGALTDTQLRASAIPVSNSSLPLPTGASTETTLAAVNTKLAGTLTVDTELPAAFTPTDSDPASQVPPLAARGFLWDATLNAAAGGWLRARGTVANGQLVDVSRVQGTVAVSGPLTDAQLRAGAVPVSGTFFQATQPVSAASLPLPTGAATNAALTDGSQRVGGTVAQLQTATTPVTASLTATGNLITIPCAGYASASWVFTTAAVATVAPEVSYDGGTTYHAIAYAGVSFSGGPSTASTPAVGLALEVGLPAHATHFRLRVSSYTSGTVTAYAAVSSAPVEPLVTASAVLNGGTAQIGSVRSAGIWYDETSTPLAGAAAFTGSSRDVLAVGPATSWAASGNTGMGSVEIRFGAIADVAGTLCLEVSRDNSTWRRVRSVAMANTGTDLVGAGGAIYEADITFKPYTRYVRAVFVNGASAQGHFMLNDFWLSA